MSREFKVHRKFYEDGRQLYKKASIILEPGITVLIGCNGAGKQHFKLQYMMICV